MNPFVPNEFRPTPDPTTSNSAQPLFIGSIVVEVITLLWGITRLGGFAMLLYLGIFIIALVIGDVRTLRAMQQGQTSFFQSVWSSAVGWVGVGCVVALAAFFLAVFGSREPGEELFQPALIPFWIGFVTALGLKIAAGVVQRRSRQPLV